jgi:signal transduction histidine kinase
VDAEQVRTVRAESQALREAFADAEALYARAHTAYEQAVATGPELLEVRRARYQLALVTERERIASQLHVGTMRFLYSIGLRLQAIENRSRETEISAELQSCVDDLDRATSELRRFVFGLGASRELAEEDPGR